MSAKETSISILCEYTLLNREHAKSAYSAPYTFEKTHDSGRTVKVILSYSDGNVVAKMDQVYVSDDVLAELESLTRFDGCLLTEVARTVIDTPLGEIRKSVGDILALVKYHLRHFNLGEESYSVKSESWCRAEDKWKEIPTTCTISVDNFSHQPLDEKTYAAVQAALTSGVLPLVAMRHLHRAKHELQPHHKWIDATIAAELAVKEILCRAHPAMESMLIEMPSPPFAKMYGSLLKHYLGDESPFRKKLIIGQERRNALVHRPGAISIDQQEANDYVADVEGAIFHMLSLLYPHDELIQQASYRTTG